MSAALKTAPGGTRRLRKPTGETDGTLTSNSMMEMERKEDEDQAAAGDNDSHLITDLREKEHRDRLILKVSKEHKWDKIVDKFKWAHGDLSPGAAEDGLDVNGRQALMKSIIDIVDNVLQVIAPDFWHEEDVHDKIAATVGQALAERDREDERPTGDSTPLGAKRQRTASSPKPIVQYTISEQSMEMRKANFGFLRLSWERCLWSPLATAACHTTYKTAVLDKLTAAELITTEAMVKDLLGDMDGWIGRSPSKDDVEKTSTKVQRLFSRSAGLAAPKGAGGAISTAIDRTFTEEGLDPQFKAATEAAAAVERLALAGGYAAMAGANVKGSLALFRSMREGGAPRGGGRGGPRGGRGREGGRGGKERVPNPDVVCWNCNEKGHPKYMCTKPIKEKGDKPEKR